MAYIYIIGLFLSSFDVQLSSLVSFSHCAVFVGRRKKLLDFFFWNWYYMCFSPSFSGVFLNIICYVKEWKFCCIWFRLVLWSQILTHFCVNVFNFLAVRHAAKKNNKICCFLTSYTYQVEFFLLIFLILWPFILWTLKKRCLETWSCVCSYCTCDLFLCFHSLWNIEKHFKKTGPGCSKAGY